MIIKRFFCKIRRCAHPNTHTTYVHICESCGENGHGHIECGNLPYLIGLMHYYHYKIPKYYRCKYYGCIDRDTHTDSGHRCICGNYGHYDNKCRLGYLFKADTITEEEKCTKKDCSECSVLYNTIPRSALCYPQIISLSYLSNNIIKEFEEKVIKRDSAKSVITPAYCIVRGNIGYIFVLRWSNRTEPVTVFLMHPEKWGQHGKYMDDRPALLHYIRHHMLFNVGR